MYILICQIIQWMYIQQIFNIYIYIVIIFTCYHYCCYYYHHYYILLQ
jgi:hypothetical protein